MTKRLPPELKRQRKSIQRACVFCHEKHIECDVSRPCKNCVKRNIATSCRDNIRKKRKSGYQKELQSPITDSELLDIDDKVSNKQLVPEIATTNISYDTIFSPDADFDSIWATDEYMKLKDVVNDPNLFMAGPDLTAIQLHTITNSIDDTLLNNYENIPDSNINSTSNSGTSTCTVFSRPFQPLDISSDTPIDDITTTKEEPLITNESSYSNDETNISPLKFREKFPTIKDLYVKKDLIKPYNYKYGYIQLKNLLDKKFNTENDKKLLRDLIKETLDNYVPKFAILTSTLIPDDLILQELILQRTLFEMEDIAFLVNCTPMAVWRRTGELCFLSNEFLSLTGFNKSEIFTDKKFIFEFWDNESVLNYFNKFERILAFDNSTESTSNILSQQNQHFDRCRLILKNNTSIKCASCWTVVRDNFNIPLLIMGQFLPIFGNR